MKTPLPSLGTLSRADGSATYIHNDYSILCGVNFPVEAPPRTSLPEECYVEVHVRPHNGVGQVKERHLERLVADTLRSVVLVAMYPRQMLQVTLQVMGVPKDEDLSGRGGGQGESYLPILPSLLNAACLGIMDAGVPMRVTFTATILGISSSGAVSQDPEIQATKNATSLHVVAFSSPGDLLLAESEGKFGIDEWERVEGLGRKICLNGSKEHEEDVNMQDLSTELEDKSLQGMLRAAVEAKVAKDERWRDG